MVQTIYGLNHKCITYIVRYLYCKENDTLFNQFNIKIDIDMNIFDSVVHNSRRHSVNLLSYSIVFHWYSLKCNGEMLNHFFGLATK